MATIHPVIDKDPHFIIDLISRAISTESKKIALMQYDHNSERFTFELPVEIEGHPMLGCDKVEVHYINIDQKTKEESAGVYEVKDREIVDDKTIAFSWLISRKATKFVGPLSFRLRFICYDAEGSIEYAWHTAIYSGIAISNGIDNGEVVIEDYADVLNDWKLGLEANQITSLEQTKVGDGDGGENIWTATFGDGRTSEFRVLNGTRGDTSLIGSIETITGEPLHFFVGTQAAYDELPEETKQEQNLFSIITDDATDDELTSLVSAAARLKGGIQKDDLNFITEDGVWGPDPCGNYWSEAEIVVGAKYEPYNHTIKGWRLSGQWLGGDNYLQILTSGKKVFMRELYKVDGITRVEGVWVQIAGEDLKVPWAEKADSALVAEGYARLTDGGGVIGNNTHGKPIVNKPVGSIITLRAAQDLNTYPGTEIQPTADQALVQVPGENHARILSGGHLTGQNYNELEGVWICCGDTGATDSDSTGSYKYCILQRVE